MIARLRIVTLFSLHSTRSGSMLNSVATVQLLRKILI